MDALTGKARDRGLQDRVFFDGFGVRSALGHKQLPKLYHLSGCFRLVQIKVRFQVVSYCALNIFLQ